MEDTGFTDKQGKPIRIGDVLQHRLDTNGKKHGGPTVVRVIRFGKHIHAVAANVTDTKYGGYKLTKDFCERSVIIDHAH